MHVRRKLPCTDVARLPEPSPIRRRRLPELTETIVFFLLVPLVDSIAKETNFAEVQAPSALTFVRQDRYTKSYKSKKQNQMNKIILFATVLSYSVIVSQSFMYVLSLKNTQLALDGTAYTQVRQLIDANMNGLFRYVMYVAIILNLVYVISNIKAPSGLLFITGAISLVALLVDGIITLKGNVPINQVINSWSPSELPANWKEVRQSWFNVYQWRQVINLTGFVSLLTGAIFGRK